MGVFDRFNQIQRSDGVSHLFQTFSSIFCIVYYTADLALNLIILLMSAKSIFYLEPMVHT